MGTVLAGVAALAAAGLGLSAFLFSQWSELRPASLQEAERAFAEAIARAGGGPAYLAISADGVVAVRRELERPEPTKLRTLHLLAWDPERERLLRIGFPFWFVRAKMTDRVNLGTLTSALARDWEHLDLKVSVEELELRGPGVVLDHRRADAGRILLWTEAPAAPPEPAQH